MVALAKPQLIDLPALEPQGKSNEWYTPARYVEAARRVMGGIDLDPASCELANRTVKATRYYTKEQNGLAQDWYGRVWLNPPYGQPALTASGRSAGGNSIQNSLLRKFIFKLLDEYVSGNVTQALLCVTSDTDAAWFQPLWQFLICFTSHRVVFVRPGLEGRAQFFGTVFVYLGLNEQAFIDEFSQFGTIAKRVSAPRAKPTPLSLWEFQAKA